MARYKDIELLDCMILSEKSDKFCEGVRFAMEKVDKLPTADVQEVRHGEWIEMAENSTGKIIPCTNCNKPINPNRKDVELHRTKEKPDYCPNCGADMRGDKNDL